MIPQTGSSAYRTNRLCGWRGSPPTCGSTNSGSTSSGTSPLKPEYKQDSAIGAVPLAGQRERTIKLDLDPSDVWQQPVSLQAPHKIPGSTHRPDGMRARWPDAGIP